MVDQVDEDTIREPRGQEASRHAVFTLPLLHGLEFRAGGAGSVLRGGTRGGLIEVAPAIHGQHGLSKMHGEGRLI